LDHSVSLFPAFFIHDSSFCILGMLMGSTSFVELLMVKVLHKDLETISSLPMLVDSHVAFAMLSLCYAQCLSYLLHTTFPSLDILQHYIEFDARTIVMLKKLLGVGSFGDSIGHLVHC